jgi:hypothetical protein
VYDRQKTLSRSWTIGRDIFFSAEDYTNVVVLDQSTVTFQKGWGEGVITICVILGIILFSDWLMLKKSSPLKQLGQMEPNLA